LERTIAQGGMSELVVGNIGFAVAGREDDADLRHLLRSNATGGWIHLALAREPDAFMAAATMGRLHGYILARDLSTREPAGMCEWSARDCYTASHASSPIWARCASRRAIATGSPCSKVGSKPCAACCTTTARLLTR
jgi:hypothetical protein